MNLKGELGVPLARLVQSVTSVVWVNNTAKTVDTTCPAGKRWLLLNVKAENRDDVNRLTTLIKYLEAAKTSQIKHMTSKTITPNTRLNWPADDDTDGERRMGTPFEIFDAGNTLSVTWAAGGASAGDTDADGLVVEYLEIDYP